MSQPPNDPLWDDGKPDGPLSPVASPPIITTVAPLRPWGFWATLAFTLIILMGWLAPQAVLAVVWMTVNSTLGSSGLESNGLFFALAVCAGTPVSIGLACLFAWIRLRTHVREYLGLRPLRLKELLRWSLALLFLAVCSDMLTMFLGRPIVPEFMVRAYESAGFAPLFWMAIVVVAPVSEEILFRGFLFEGICHSRLGPSGAVAMTALFWSLVHVQYDWYGVSTIFISGLLLGFVRLKTQSVWATSCLHSLMNFIATAEVAFLPSSWTA